MKKILVIVLVVCMFNLAGCNIIFGTLNDLEKEYDKSVDFAKQFCLTLSNDDFEASKEYLHPSSSPSKDGLSKFVSKMEETNEIDFSNGIEIKNVEFKRMGAYIPEYRGSIYNFTFELSVSNKVINMFFLVVDNDEGYGVFYFGVIE